MKMDNVEPVVTGPHTKYAGKRYKLGKLPYMARHTGTNTNGEAWAVIEAMFRLSPTIDFWDLCVACRHHKHGTKAAKGPQSWIRYLIRNEYLVLSSIQR